MNMGPPEVLTCPTRKSNELRLQEIVIKLIINYGCYEVQKIVLKKVQKISSLVRHIFKLYRTH